MNSRPAAAQHLRDLARLRRVRDRIDREYAQPLMSKRSPTACTCRPERKGVTISPSVVTRDNFRLY
jgi:hypothetical protein